MSTKNQQLLTVAFCVYAVSTLISMAVMSIGLGVLLVGMLVAFCGPRPLLADIRDGLRASRLERVYLGLSFALSVICVASLIAGKLFPLSYGGKFSEVHIFRDSLKLWYLFWPLVLLAGLRRLSDSHRATILKSWLIAFFGLSLIGIVQHRIGWPRPQGIPTGAFLGNFHTTLFLGHHLSVASIFIFPFFAALDQFKRSLCEKTLGLSKVFWSLAVIAGFIALVFTYSRTLWIALPVGIVLWIAINLPKRWSFALGALVVLGMLWGSQRPIVRSRFGDTYGMSTRQDLWKANFEFLRERPILGVGWKHNQELSGFYLMQKYPGQEVFSGHAHNNIIDMLGGTGIAGAIVWSAWCLYVLALSWMARKQQASSALVFASGLFCAWVVFQINGLTQVNFWEAKVTHQMMWMAAWPLLWLSPHSSRSGRESARQERAVGPPRQASEGAQAS